MKTDFVLYLAHVAELANAHTHTHTHTYMYIYIILNKLPCHVFLRKKLHSLGRTTDRTKYLLFLVKNDFSTDECVVY